MPELLITLSDGRVLRRTLAARPVVLGRDAGCDIPIDDPSTSRRHAKITPTDEGYIVEDLGSKNGTLVNDTPGRSTPLRAGDRILMGSVLAIFHQEPLTSPSVVLSDDPSASRATRYVPADQGLLLSQRRLETLYGLSERLTTLQEREAMLANAMEVCCEMLHFERGAIGVRRRNQRTLDWPVVRNLRGAEGELTISRTLLNRALEHGERAIFTSGQASADPTVSMVQHGIRSAMCVPLVHGENTIGVIYGDRTTTSTSYTSEDIDFFAAIARQISIGIINAQLLEDQKQMVALQHDLDLARNIQNGLFPKNLPNTAELRIAALNDPGRRVSGDYYDVIQRPDGRVWCLVADVTGEGAPAAIQMANLQAVVRATIGESDDPGRLLTRWNEFICTQSHESRIVTCVLALIDPKARTVAVACAGHWPPLLVDDADHEVREIEVDAGFPLGVMDDTVYATRVGRLSSVPHLLFCYTDGVIEAMNPQGEAFSPKRLHEVLGQRGEFNPAAIVKQIRKQVSSFASGAEQSDDITMLAARIGS
jgi:serine phosphatase RsbU (regulator of sigma subunit)